MQFCRILETKRPVVVLTKRLASLNLSCEVEEYSHSSSRTQQLGWKQGLLIFGSAVAERQLCAEVHVPVKVVGAIDEVSWK